MSIGEVTALLRDGILQIIMLSAPMLLSALVVGLVIAILQATTSIQEQTLTFVPKLAVILIVLAFLGPQMFSSLMDYTRDLFMQIERIGRG